MFQSSPDPFKEVEMADIDAKEITSGANAVFEVTVREGGSSSQHRVTLPEERYQALTKGKVSKADCVKAAFRFMLDREPKESILSQFEISVISRYFPEFEREFSNYVR